VNNVKDEFRTFFKHRGRSGMLARHNKERRAEGFGCRPFSQRLEFRDHPSVATFMISSTFHQEEDSEDAAELRAAIQKSLEWERIISAALCFHPRYVLGAGRIYHEYLRLMCSATSALSIAHTNSADARIGQTRYRSSKP
jgi:hypothetical protein